MINKELEEAKVLESQWYDECTINRIKYGRIPMEADIRRAERYIPISSNEQLVDPEMSNLLEKRYRDIFIKEASYEPGGSVLDLCCGPGWLALELARNGQHVEAYDLSKEAISFAKKIADENPYLDNFGSVNYYAEDVTKIDLGIEKFNAITGWSAWHHLNNLNDFVNRAYLALKPGGVVATFDDVPVTQLEKSLSRFFRIILPTYDRTYSEKCKNIFNIIFGKTKIKDDYFTPMEEFAAKDTAVDEIADLFYEKFDVIYDKRYFSFAHNPSMSLIGPDWFRYSTAKFLINLDEFLCKIGLTKGYYRIIIAKKK